MSILVSQWRQMFGSMILERREAIGRSVEEAAWLAGMASSEWAAIEAGHIPADPARLRSMAPLSKFASTSWPCWFISARERGRPESGWLRYS